MKMKRQSVIVSVLLLLLGSTGSGAAQGFWEGTCGLAGKKVRSLAVNTSGHIFAGLEEGGGVFRSMDNGDTWTQSLAYHSVLSLAITPSGHIFAGTGSQGVFRSTDNGQSWMQVGLTQVFQVLSLAVTPAGHLFAGTNRSDVYGVFRSSDNGDSWTPVNSGFPRTPVVVLAVSASGYIFAGTEHSGVLRSTNDGDNWAQSGLGDTAIYSLAMGPSGDIFAGGFDGRVLRSSDEGDNWTQIHSGLPGGFVSLAIRSNGDIFAGSYEGGVSLSTDHGDTWEPINRGLTNPTIAALAVNANGEALAGTWGSGLFVYRPALSSSLYFPQVADGAVGTIRFQSTFILVNTSADTDLRLEFYSSPDGEPMALTLGGLGASSMFEFELKKGESISLATPGTGPLQVGYARVSASPDVGGVIVFRGLELPTGISLYEAGVPASTPLEEFSVHVDSIGIRDTGVAIAYPRQEDATSSTEVADANVTIKLYDNQYRFVAEKTLNPMTPGSHLSCFVHEIFDDPGVKALAQEMEGLLVVESSQPLVAVTLRQNDDPLQEFPDEVPHLTTFPVTPAVPK